MSNARGADRLTEMVERSWAVLGGLRRTPRWLLAFSGGKDSTTVLVLAIEFLRQQRPAGVSLEIQETRIAVSSDGKQALVWFDHWPHRKPLLELYPFSHSLDGAAWRYAQRTVASIAKSMGFLEAIGFGDAMGGWLRGCLEQPPAPSACVGVGFGFPRDAPEGTWSRFAAIYYDRRQRAARPDLAIWPDPGEDESEDELARFGLRYMVEEIGL